jgi:hypothetical protein
MPELKTIVVVHTTADEPNAGSDANFELEIGRPGADLVKPFPNNPNVNERERGQMDLYKIDVSRDNVNTEVAGFNLVMKIKSGDGWLPASILVFGESKDHELIVLGDRQIWEDGWFDKGPGSVGEEAHTISF